MLDIFPTFSLLTVFNGLSNLGTSQADSKKEEYPEVNFQLPEPLPAQTINGKTVYPSGYFPKSNTSRSKQFGTVCAIGVFLWIAEEWAFKHPDKPMRIGEISQERGGKFEPHKGNGHSYGVAIDIGLFRKSGRDEGVTFNDPDYDDSLVLELALHLLQYPGVTLLIFNRQFPLTYHGDRFAHDREGGHIHDNHIHVEFEMCSRRRLRPGLRYFD